MERCWSSEIVVLGLNQRDSNASRKSLTHARADPRHRTWGQRPRALYVEAHIFYIPTAKYHLSSIYVRQNYQFSCTFVLLLLCY
jgi:hypothetical protein